MTGVQRTESFAGVWGVPSKPLFPSPPTVSSHLERYKNDFEIDCSYNVAEGVIVFFSAIIILVPMHDAHSA